ncbi:hypothetical protein ACTL6U_14500 [Rhodovibrionaceae bacterium A322]
MSISSISSTLTFLADSVIRPFTSRDSGKVTDVNSTCRFVSTRAAFVAQKSLYGYLKTRMGIRYPKVFDDDEFIASINIAKLHVYAACLSDLAIYASACGLRDSDLPFDLRQALALKAFRQGLEDNQGEVATVEEFSSAQSLTEFEARLKTIDWQEGPLGMALFTASPEALYRWAPIAPNLKKEDEEIVKNSIRFMWRDLREQFEKRLDKTGLANDLLTSDLSLQAESRQ